MKDEAALKKYSGARLKQIRLEKGMTQQEVAAQLTVLKNDHTVVTRQTISKYENGERGMNLEVISELSTIFQISVNYFFPNPVFLEDTLKQDTKNLYTKTIADDEGFCLEIKTAVTFDELSLEMQKEITDSAMQELLHLKEKIREHS